MNSRTTRPTLWKKWQQFFCGPHNQRFDCIIKKYYLKTLNIISIQLGFDWIIKKQKKVGVT